MKIGKNIYDFFINVKNLELKTDEGKVNYRWGLLLVVLTISLTATNWLLKGLAFIVGAIKTFILGVNIVENYEETSTTLLIMLTVAFFVLCIIILIVLDMNKRKLSEKINKVEKQEVSNPIDKI